MSERKMNKDEINDIVERLQTDIESVSLTEYKNLLSHISQDIMEIISNYPLSNSDILTILDTVRIYIIKRQIEGCLKNEN